ncbi:hypothetical protein P3702_24775, partial [Vibrio parahaemolyticus]|nr:hypothetical protein [Vibrio parahaemolyticus]
VLFLRKNFPFNRWRDWMKDTKQPLGYIHGLKENELTWFDPLNRPKLKQNQKLVKPTDRDFTVHSSL